MGYISDISGKLDVSYNEQTVKEYPEDLLALASSQGIKLPPLTNRTGLSKQTIEILKNHDASYWFQFDENYVDASYGESGKAYEFERELKEVLEIIEEDNCTANGILVRSGEEQGDMERFIVENNKIVRTESARLLWPDGTEAV